MKSVVALLAALALASAAAVLWPERTLSPGDLRSAHQRIAADCFRCHAVLFGSSTAKCIACHPVAEIGRRTGQGSMTRPAFHQALADTSCRTCHREHREPLGNAALPSFAHEALRAEVRQECVECHGAQRPRDDIHQDVGSGCGGCHRTTGWKPAEFTHERLSSDRLRDCKSCHARHVPSDGIHESSGLCSACHRTSGWKPSTFDHGRYFRFDEHHGPSCAPCHPASTNLTHYSCFGCHEHTAESVAREHREEGISDTANCVACHRGADEREEGERRGGGHGRREHGHEKDDD